MYHGENTEEMSGKKWGQGHVCRVISVMAMPLACALNGVRSLQDFEEETDEILLIFVKVLREWAEGRQGRSREAHQEAPAVIQGRGAHSLHPSGVRGGGEKWLVALGVL